jgi:hypothetical protein
VILILILILATTEYGVQCSTYVYC